jgi:two-component system CheB/CheR fusion protein
MAEATGADITAHKAMEPLLTLDRERLAEEVDSTARELSGTQKELQALTASLFSSQEEERRRVARELHDDISQKLALLEIDAQQVEPKIESNPVQARKELESLRTAIGDLSEEVRRISHGLYPSVIEDLGIAPAIRSLVEDFGQREEMTVTFRAENVPDNVPLEIATGMYRIAQEALRNVAKHAGRTYVKVLLAGGPGRLRLQVIDAGKGFDTRALTPGLGLIGAGERVRIMRGVLTIESKPGEGTRLSVDAPLP